MRLRDWECGSRELAGNVLIRSDLVLHTLVARPHDGETSCWLIPPLGLMLRVATTAAAVHKKNDHYRSFWHYQGCLQE
jgi:hypothetical protein